MRCNCCPYITILNSDCGNLLSYLGIEDDPFLSLNFADDIRSWPNANLGQIFTYFLENKANKSEYFDQ